MLLRDPYALSAICSSILKCLTQLYENYKLPRVSVIGYTACGLGCGVMRDGAALCAGEQ